MDFEFDCCEYEWVGLNNLELLRLPQLFADSIFSAEPKPIGNFIKDKA